MSDEARARERQAEVQRKLDAMLANPAAVTPEQWAEFFQRSSPAPSRQS